MTTLVLDFPDLPVEDEGTDWLRHADALSERLADLEQVVRWCEAEVVDVLDRVDRLGVYSVDGHRNIRSWAAANVKWSGRETLDRARTVTLVRDVPEIATELAAGRIGVAQVRELARVRANPRCGEQIVDAATELVDAAQALEFDQFRLISQRWEQLHDADGSHRGHEAAHEGRRVSTSMLGDTFHLAAQFGAVQGAAVAEILRRFEQAEFDIEWDELNARFGDEACASMLERTNSQRRADAVHAIFRAAISSPAHTQPPEPVVNIIIDQVTFETHMTAAATGEPAPRRDPADTGGRCETDTGVIVSPADAIAAALVGYVRRVVMNAAGVVIDMGRKQRLFTGAARTAVFLQDGRRCLWPGCGRDHRTHIDHSTDWQYEGRTAPYNAGPLCPFHNRFKNHGYRVERDERGRWHVTRPNGIEITGT